MFPASGALRAYARYKHSVFLHKTSPTEPNGNQRLRWSVAGRFYTIELKRYYIGGRMKKRSSFFVKSLAEVEAFLGVPAGTINDAVERPDGFDLGECARSLVKKMARVDTADARLRKSMQKSLARRQAAQAEREELTTAERAGRLIEREEAERDKVALAEMFVGCLDRACAELPLRVVGKSVTDTEVEMRRYFDSARAGMVDQ